jgi:hypothetical protein
MYRPWRLGVCLLVALGLIALASVSTSRAGLGDSLKKKVEQEADKKTDEALGKATGETGEAAEGQKAAEGESAPATGAAGGQGGGISSVSTKFDYVPGDSVLLYDDFTQDDWASFQPGGARARARSRSWSRKGNGGCDAPAPTAGSA